MTRRCTYKACDKEAQVTVVVRDVTNHGPERKPMCRSHAWDATGKPLVTLEPLTTEDRSDD